jgi:hypothetical protein
MFNQVACGKFCCAVVSETFAISDTAALLTEACITQEDHWKIF